MKNREFAASSSSPEPATDPTPEQTVDGIRVATPGGGAPSESGALAYVEGSRIRTIKVIQDIRGCGIGDIDELTRTIRSDGMIEPLLVRPAGDGKSLDLIAGERRLEAARAVGGKTWECVPVIIRLDLQSNDDKAIAVAVRKNSPDDRSNLNIVEIGRQVVRLNRKGWTPERMAKEMGLHIHRVRWALELNDAAEHFQDQVRRGRMTNDTMRTLMKHYEFARTEPIDRFVLRKSKSSLRGHRCVHERPTLCARCNGIEAVHSEAGSDEKS